YTLETSRDGRHFTPIAEIMAFNHVSGRAEYNYTHILNDNGKYFFRLSSLGLNGHTEQTKVIVLQNAEALAQIRVVPNPASGTGIGVELSSSATTNTYTWQIHSPAGKLL